MGAAAEKDLLGEHGRSPLSNLSYIAVDPEFEKRVRGRKDKKAYCWIGAGSSYIEEHGELGGTHRFHDLHIRPLCIRNPCLSYC